jgi:hypothetical protein
MLVPMRRAVAILAVMAFTSVARADDYDAAMATAAAAKEKALDQNDAATWLEAYKAFESADAIRSTKESKYELATAAVKLKADDVAYQAYEDAIALGLDGPGKITAQTFLDARAPNIARLMVRGPDGAEVSVGGRVRGRLPLARAIVVFAGKISVRVGDRTDTLTTEPGKETTLDVAAPKKVEPPPPTPPPEKKPIEVAPQPRGGLGFVVAGGAVIAVGVAGYIVSQATIDARRESLNETCTFPHPRDYCVDTWPERVPFAQSDSDAIASWKVIRAVSVATAIVGVGLTTYGIIRLTAAPTASSNHVGFTVAGQF